MKKIDIETAIKALRAGELVAIPTETVYGLAADATNAEAVRQIFQVKERPYDHPLIVHIADGQALADWAKDVPPYALALAKQFWPGPLTLVLKKQPQVLTLLTGGQETIGIRVPNHPVTLTLLRRFGGGVAAPSANRFTHVSPTTISAVEEELGDRIDWALEGGDCAVGLESTILDVTGDSPVLLRPGMISPQDIVNVVARPVVVAQRPLLSHTRAPGMHHLHYAPQTKMRLLPSDQIVNFLQTWDQDEFPIALMTYTAFSVTSTQAIHRIMMPDDVQTYAHDLYDRLRKLDHLDCKLIIVEAVPDLPEWDAIRDRLHKASS